MVAMKLLVVAGLVAADYISEMERLANLRDMDMIDDATLEMLKKQYLQDHLAELQRNRAVHQPEPTEVAGKRRQLQNSQDVAQSRCLASMVADNSEMAENCMDQVMSVTNPAITGVIQYLVDNGGGGGGGDVSSSNLMVNDQFSAVYFETQALIDYLGLIDNEDYQALYVEHQQGSVTPDSWHPPSDLFNVSCAPPEKPINAWGGVDSCNHWSPNSVHNTYDGLLSSDGSWQDGSNFFHTLTDNDNEHNWLQWDLGACESGASPEISGFTYWGRNNCCEGQCNSLWLIIGDQVLDGALDGCGSFGGAYQDGLMAGQYGVVAQQDFNGCFDWEGQTYQFDAPITGRYVTVTNPYDAMTVQEVSFF